MFGKTIEQLKEDFAQKREVLKEDEYLKDGLPFCKQCNTPRYFSFGENVVMRGLCECQKANRREKEEKERKTRLLQEFNDRRRLSLIGDRYKNIFFKNATITDNNKKAFQKAKNYVKNDDKMLANNIGLYLYGDNSSGKTFLTACMCNELVLKGRRCIYTNLASILNEIRASFDGNGLGVCDLLSRLQLYDFVFIDDIGKEFLGREFNVASSKWAEEKFFEVLNARYNAQKPTIFSSNYSIGELAQNLNLDKAIVERINEMATRVIKLDGDDFRKIAREEKSEIAKSFGV